MSYRFNRHLTLGTLALTLGLATLVGCERKDAAAPAAQPVADHAADHAAATTADLPAPPCCPLPGEKAAAAPAVADATPAAPTAPAVTPEAPEPATTVDQSPQPPARLSPWLATSERQPFDLDYNVTDQNGRSLKLADLKGKPWVLSWMYTRCPDPNMCPLVTVKFANLQREVAAAGIAGDVRLVLISYDPSYDTPERLKRYGEQRGIKFEMQPETLMLRADLNQFRALLSEFQIHFKPSTTGQFSHGYELILVDDQGRFVRDHQGNIWDNAQVTADLQRLVAEQRGEAAPAAAQATPSVPATEVAALSQATAVATH